MILHVLRPEAHESEALTKICIESKKHWGYPEFMINMWRDELTITPRYIRNNDILKVQKNKCDQIPATEQLALELKWMFERISRKLQMKIW